jgi:hypothetical protein
MKRRYNQFNTKRRILSEQARDHEQERLSELAEMIAYGGNPEHKINPGDFGLTPPSNPRSGKSLCDSARIFQRDVALELLKQGLKRGLVSDREEDGWPKNIWAVTDSEIPLEAQLENSVRGSYHGYPMPESDPLAEEVLKLWKVRHV